MSDDITDIRMPERCQTCAFRAGTRASQSPTTLLKAKLCIISGSDFICHESARPAWCAGVMDAIEAQTRNGTRPPDWHPDVALKLLDVLSHAEGNPSASDAELIAELHKALEATP